MTDITNLKSFELYTTKKDIMYFYVRLKNISLSSDEIVICFRDSSKFTSFTEDLSSYIYTNNEIKPVEEVEDVIHNLENSIIYEPKTPKKEKSS